MRIALKDLNPDHLWIIYPGQHPYPVDQNISMLPLNLVENLLDLKEPM